MILFKGVSKWWRKLMFIRELVLGVKGNLVTFFIQLLCNQNLENINIHSSQVSCALNDSKSKGGKKYFLAPTQKICC